MARYGEDDFSGTAVSSVRERVALSRLGRAGDQPRYAVRSFPDGATGGRPDERSRRFCLPPALLGLGPWYYGIAQPAQSRADERHDRVDMVTRGMLGVTVACARCHDHKYDPFTAKDYYALAGVFASTAYKEYPLVPEAEVKAWKKQKKELDAAEKALEQVPDEQSGPAGRNVLRSRIADYMMATVDPAARRLAYMPKFSTAGRRIWRSLKNPILS